MSPDGSQPDLDAAGERLDEILPKIVRLSVRSLDESEKSPTVLAKLEKDDSVYVLVRFRKRTGKRRLTPRETEIARLASEGLSNKKIAERIAISVATVAAHLRRVYTKLGVGSRVELVCECLLLRAEAED